MIRLFAGLLVFAALLGSGVIHGLWTNRWSGSGATEAAAARLADVPRAIEDWEGQDEEMDPRAVTIAQISGYLQRRYVNRRTGNVVTLLIVCGRPGPVSVHVPEVCYRGAGYEPMGERKRYDAPNSSGAEFWVTDFRKPGALGQQLRIFYSWSAAGAWKAPENSRLTFARSPALYKMYVVRELPRGEERLEEDPCLDFLHELLPQLQKSLFPAS